MYELTGTHGGLVAIVLNYKQQFLEFGKYILVLTRSWVAYTVTPGKRLTACQKVTQDL